VLSGIRYAVPAPTSRQTESLPICDDLAGDVEYDACVIGSGAGGSAAAAQLAAAGFRVVVLEAADARQANQFEPLELEGLRSLYWQRGLLATHDLSTMIIAGSALGGGTTVNWQTSLRTPDDVRAEWAERSGCHFLAGPDFSAALDAVCARLSVNTAESQVNRNNEILQRGCDALGYHWDLIPRNARGCDPAQCGFCMFGCPTGGKQSAAVTFLRDAVATGRATLVGNCQAERIEHTAGRVTGVTARLGERRVRVRATTVVVAAGGIESPALLLRSGITLPALGRHLHLHPTTCVAGFFAEPVRAWLGPPQTVVCDEFASLSDGHGFRLETAPAHPGLFALAMPWRNARAHRELMQDFDHAATLIVLARDHSGGRVSIDRRGATRVDYTVGPRERGYLARGAAAAARVLAAAGAERITTLHSQPIEWQARDNLDAYCQDITSAPLDRNWSPVLTAHQLGTCRMGSSPDAAVCNQNGAVFGVRGLFIGDASALPGSCGVNPMITVAAFGWWVGGRIVSASGQ
jgi:choline dehydrogenase-like flavoprotein